jgi:hypothetical protein
MSDVKIEKYTVQGFELSHKILPKNIWVDFHQFPLTNLTIINGIVKDEITFVENINGHYMELIKTDMLDYIELLSIRQNEVKIKYYTPFTINPGDIVKSALCNGGAEMIFLGNFYTKNIEEQTSYGRNYYRDYSTTKDYYLSKNSPQRALFLIKDNTLSRKEMLNLSKQYDIYQDDNSWRLEKEAQIEYNRKNSAHKKASADLLKSSPFDRFKIEGYSVTSKVIRNMVKVGKIDERFTDEENNAILVLNDLNDVTPHYNYRREYPVASRTLNCPLTPKIEASTYIITGYQYATDIKYMSKDKTNIDENAVKFINEHYNIKLNSKIYYE